MWAEWSCRMLQVLVFRRRNEPRFWFLFSKWEHSYFSAIWYSCASDSKTQPPYWAWEIGLLADSFPLSNPCSIGRSTSAPIHTLLKQRLPWWAICRVTNGSLELWRRIWALCIKCALGLPNYNQDSPATSLPPLHVGGKGVLLIVLRATALVGMVGEGTEKLFKPSALSLALSEQLWWGSLYKGFCVGVHTLVWRAMQDEAAYQEKKD